MAVGGGRSISDFDRDPPLLELARRRNAWAGSRKEQSAAWISHRRERPLIEESADTHSTAGHGQGVSIAVNHSGDVLVVWQQNCRIERYVLEWLKCLRGEEAQQRHTPLFRLFEIEERITTWSPPTHMDIGWTLAGDPPTHLAVPTEDHPVVRDHQKQLVMGG